MYKKVLVGLFLVQLLSAQDVSMKIGTLVVAKDRKFTSFFNNGMDGRAKALDADLVRLQEGDLTENLLIEKGLDVLVYATYADELTPAKTTLLRSIDATKSYSAVILWVTQPGFAGEPTLPLNIDAVGGASAKPISIRIISQEVTPRLQEIKKILANGMSDMQTEEATPAQMADAHTKLSIATLVVAKDRKFTSFFNNGMDGRAKALDADLVRLQEKDLKENLLTEAGYDVLVYATYADELSPARTALLKSIDATKSYSAVILWVTQPGFTGEPDLPINIDAVGGASAKPVSIKIISQEVTPRLQEIKTTLGIGEMASS